LIYKILLLTIVRFLVLILGNLLLVKGSLLVADKMSKVIDLYEFLLEAELHQYYSELKNDLKASFTTLIIFNHNVGNYVIECIEFIIYHCFR